MRPKLGISTQGFKRLVKVCAATYHKTGNDEADSVSEFDFLSDLDKDPPEMEIDVDRRTFSSMYGGWYAGLAAAESHWFKYPENLEEMLKDEIAAHASATFDPDAFRGAFILAYKPEDSQEYQNAVKEWGGELSKVMEVIEKL